MNIRIFTDGGSKGNPGPAAIGIVIYEGQKELLRYREDIGIGTNNEAEYRALIKALELAKEKAWKLERIDCYLDSKLVVQQVNGIFKIKEARMRDFIFKIRVLESELRIPVHYHHIPREENVLADALVNNKA